MVILTSAELDFSVISVSIMENVSRNDSKLQLAGGFQDIFCFKFHPILGNLGMILIFQDLWLNQPELAGEIHPKSSLVAPPGLCRRGQAYKGVGSWFSCQQYRFWGILTAVF